MMEPTKQGRPTLDSSQISMYRVATRIVEGTERERGKNAYLALSAIQALPAIQSVDCFHDV